MCSCVHLEYTFGVLKHSNGSDNEALFHQLRRLSDDRTATPPCPETQEMRFPMRCSCCEFLRRLAAESRAQENNIIQKAVAVEDRAEDLCAKIETLGECDESMR